MKLYERPLIAIRKNCLDCVAGSHKEVKLCPSLQCHLWPYRLGKRPDSSIITMLKEFHEENHD